MPMQTLVWNDKAHNHFYSFSSSVSPTRHAEPEDRGPQERRPFRRPALCGLGAGGGARDLSSRRSFGTRQTGLARSLR